VGEVLCAVGVTELPMDRLIDVAETGVVLAQEIESGLRLPAGVAEFDDEGVLGKAF